MRQQLANQECQTLECGDPAPRRSDKLCRRWQKEQTVRRQTESYLSSLQLHENATTGSIRRNGDGSLSTHCGSHGCECTQIPHPLKARDPSLFAPEGLFSRWPSETCLLERSTGCFGVPACRFLCCVLTAYCLKKSCLELVRFSTLNPNSCREPLM